MVGEGLQTFPTIFFLCWHYVAGHPAQNILPEIGKTLGVKARCSRHATQSPYRDRRIAP